MVKVTALGSLLPEIFVFMYIQNTFFTLLANRVSTPIHWSSGVVGNQRISQLPASERGPEIMGNCHIFCEDS